MRLALAPAMALLVTTLPTSVPEASASSTDRTTTAFVVRSPAISEDSGLVRRHRLFVTTNDSGDVGRLFVLNRRGSTVGVTHWSSHPSDCEGLAPADPGHVWVGDIGDNARQRTSISISRVPVGRGHRTVHVPTYRLVYPNGPADAESLMRNPASGRLYIATKDVSGGTLYAVPLRLSRAHANRLRAIGRVLPIATDGAFLPGGRFLVIRSYTRGALYRWPSMRSVGSFSLPRQQQGEGLAAASDGVLFLSSEGIHQPVLRTLLPAALRRIVKADASRAATSALARLRVAASAPR